MEKLFLSQQIKFPFSIHKIRGLFFSEVARCWTVFKHQYIFITGFGEGVFFIIIILHLKVKSLMGSLHREGIVPGEEVIYDKKKGV